MRNGGGGGGTDGHDDSKWHRVGDRARDAAEREREWKMKQEEEAADPVPGGVLRGRRGGRTPGSRKQ